MKILIAAIISAACVTGAAVDDPPLTAESVRELRRLVNALPGAAFIADRYDPRDVIAAVNALQEYGKDQSLRALAHCPGGARIVVMRFLFESPANELHPVISYTRSEFLTEADPRFPAIVIEGVPLYLVAPTGGSGAPRSPYEYLDWYREHGEMREDPLHPTDDPLTVWDRWRQGGLRARIAEHDPSVLAKADRCVQEQLLRMVDTIHPREFDEDTLRHDDVSVLWERAVATLQRTETVWDDERNIYTRADGSFEPSHIEPEYRPALWWVSIEGRSVTLRIQRISESTVLISTYQSCRDAPPAADVQVCVFREGDPDGDAVVSFELEGSFTSGTQGGSAEVELEKGAILRAALLIDDEVVERSRPLSPDRQK